MWNAKIATHEGNSYIVKNANWNQDLASGSSVNIGFEASWDKEIKVPQNYDLLVTKQDVSNEDYAIDFKVTSDWGQAFNGEISITNNTKETIEDWSLELDLNKQAIDAITYLHAMCSKYPNKRIYVTGYSLGGYLSLYSTGYYLNKECRK